MAKLRLLLPAVIIFFLFPNPVFCQEHEPSKRLCPLCKTTGKIANPFYEAVMEQEKGVIYCSKWMEDDKKGMGMPWLPCEGCRNEQLKAKAVEEFNKEIEIRKAWLAERRDVDKFLKAKKPLLHLQTEHFTWCWGISKVKVGKRVLRAHEALHLYAARMEKFYSEFQRVHKITDADNGNNIHFIYAFERMMVGQRATSKYTGNASKTGASIKIGDPSGYVTTWNKNKMATEEEFHNNMIHVAVHLFTGAYKEVGYWAYPVGVAYEGLAHWWEFYWYNMATTHCAQEQSGMNNWEPREWRPKVRKKVLANRVPSIAESLLKDTGSLNASEHFIGWSYIDYMMSMDTRKTLDFIAVLKEKVPAREAFTRVWKMSPLSFEEKWKEYVKTVYVQKDKRIPMCDKEGLERK